MTGLSAERPPFAVRIASRFESWIFEILGVISLSLAANLFTTVCAERSKLNVAGALAIIAWTSSGALGIFAAKTFLRYESDYLTRDTAERKTKRPAYIASELGKEEAHCWALVALTSTLLTGVALTAIWAILVR